MILRIILLASLTSCQTLLGPKTPEIYGHRGARAIYPENSLQALEYAMDVGVEWLEFDLHLTKDGIFVLNHDPTVPKRCVWSGMAKRRPKTRVVARLTFQQVQKFDCGKKRDSEGFPRNLKSPTRIPSFAQAFRLIQEKNSDQNLSLEMKYFERHKDQYPPMQRVISKAVALVEKYELQGRVALQSFDRGLLLGLRRAFPRDEGVGLVYLYYGEREGPKNWVPDWQRAKEFLEKHRFEVFSPFYGFMNQPEHQSDFLRLFGREQREDKYQLVPFTINDVADWQRLLDVYQVDGIITDRPSELKNFMENYEPVVSEH